MPYKVYANMPLGLYYSLPRVWRRRRKLARYMSVLLLKDRGALLSPPCPSVSPTLTRLIDVLSPTSTLSKMAADAGLIHSHVVDVVSHYIHWGDMMILYPVCAKNLYVMSSKAIEIVSQHNLCRKYEESFLRSSCTLYQLLQLFSVPISPQEFTDSVLSLNKKHEGVFMILWLLEKCLITQVHQYVLLSVPTRGIAPLQPSNAGHNFSGSISRAGDAPHRTTDATSHRLSFDAVSNFSNNNSSDISTGYEETISSIHQEVLRHNRRHKLSQPDSSDGTSHSDVTEHSRGTKQSVSNYARVGFTTQDEDKRDRDFSYRHRRPSYAFSVDLEEEAELLALLQKSSMTSLECCAALTLYATHSSVISMDDLCTFIRYCIILVCY